MPERAMDAGCGCLVLVAKRTEQVMQAIRTRNELRLRRRFSTVHHLAQLLFYFLLCTKALKLPLMREYYFVFCKIPTHELCRYFAGICNEKESGGSFLFSTLARTQPQRRPGYAANNCELVE
jgi:hypothetical protein